MLGSATPATTTKVAAIGTSHRARLSLGEGAPASLAVIRARRASVAASSRAIASRSRAAPSSVLAFLFELPDLAAAPS